MKYEDSANFLENMSRRGRKRVAVLITATHGFYEFTGSQQGKSILTNSATMMLMRQSPADIDAIKELLNLPMGQLDVVRKLEIGEGLLRLGDRATAVRVTALPFEYGLIQTGVTAMSKACVGRLLKKQQAAIFYEGGGELCPRAHARQRFCF